MAVVEGGVVSTADVAVHGALSLAVLTAGLSLAGVAQESGTSAVIALVTTGLAIPNLAAPWPFDQAAEEWQEVSAELHTFHSELSDLINKRSGLNDSWEGPGADAFCAYVNNKLLPAIEELADCATDLRNACRGVSETLTGGIIEYFLLTGIAIAACIALTVTKNPILYLACALAKAAIVESWLIGLTLQFRDIYNTLTALEAEQARLRVAYENLISRFGFEGDRLDAAALEIMRRRVLPAMQDVDGWNKA
ncbi:hypothetical protein [Actinopolymorpha sp. B9G3]|uniref:WXG100 family type VII secretion target n=1 Tax=Actinopolymorpha sp. B9G3 TaxID=3158970 RepID=UPI0032D8EEEA